MATDKQRRRLLLLAGSLAALGAAVATSEFLKLATTNGRDNSLRPENKSGDLPASTFRAAPPSMYSASADNTGQYFLSRMPLATGENMCQPLPFRAHDVLPLGGDQVLAFGRRPDVLCAFVNMHSSEQQLIEAAAGRHFYGHGCLSADGSVLFTTENDFEAARGVIGIRDARSFEQVGEYQTYGIGPHDIHLMPDGKTLVIANGGIETHPDFGRRKLNLKTMQPSLVYVDSASGKKIDEYRLEDHQLSIRHLAVSAAGDVGVATQYQGDIYRRQPQTLVAWQPFGGELQSLAVAPQDISGCRGYMADLAYADAAGLLAVTSPRGNRVTFWDVGAMAFVSALAVPEPSGVEYLAAESAFVVSSAKGGVYQIKVGQALQLTTVHQLKHTQWDNHLLLG